MARRSIDDVDDEKTWIVDVHTLALKIRGFFEQQIRQSNIDDPKEVDTCCASYTSYIDRQEWNVEDFQSHGQFQLAYHPYDPNELIQEQLKSAVHTIWVLPYAHKANISSSLNSSVAEICATMADPLTTQPIYSTRQSSHSSSKLHRAIAAFTVHDGLEGVRQTTIDALIKSHAKVAKLHCSVGNYSILHPNLSSFWEIANQILLPVIVHLGSHLSGNTASSELKEVEQLLQKYHNVPFIIAHSGHPAVQGAIKLAKQFDTIYLDTTPVVTRFPAYPPTSHPLHEDLIHLATNGRILFGTDMPNVAVKLPDQIQAVYHTFAREE